MVASSDRSRRPRLRSTLLAPLALQTWTIRYRSAQTCGATQRHGGQADQFEGGLLGRLEAAFEVQRHFAANASHELRTPLTVARTLLEMVRGDPDATVESYRAVCLDVLEAGEQQEQLIDALLTLARSQRGLDQRQPLDLAVIATEVVHARELCRFRAEGATSTCRSAQPCSPATPTLSNASSGTWSTTLHYNLPGGNVHVLVDGQGGQASLKVTNTGPVVPPDQLDRLLQPFQRLATDRAVNPRRRRARLVHRPSHRHRHRRRPHPPPR